MKQILPLLLLATLGCDSTGITGSVDGATDPGTEPGPDADAPVASPHLTDYSKGDCMDHVCPPDDPGAEFLEASWAGMYEPDCVNVIHRCAPFNCCTDLSAWLDYSGSTLTVYLNERETGEECWCMCHYHARYTICGLTPGSWLVAIEASGLSARVTVP